MSPISRKFRTLERLGPEHEFSIVDEDLRPQPIVDKIIKQLAGRIKNDVTLSNIIFGKELQAHVAEFKGDAPFASPSAFEETMYHGVIEVLQILDRFGVKFLGLGMHPTLSLSEAKVWSHRDRGIHAALDKVFGLGQHGWLNIQSFQLNLSYFNETEAVRAYNILTTIVPYLPAISASSPIYDSKFGEYADNRLYFYKTNQKQVPSITGEIVPEYIDSFKTYCDLTIRKYSKDLVEINASPCLVNKSWINSRGAVIRFERKAIEIRVMDEQECIKSDVALSCFIRALLRGLMKQREKLLHHLLVEDLNSVIKDGLDAKVRNPVASTARDVCRHLCKIAEENSTSEEKSYLGVIKKRIENGNLSQIVAEHVRRRLKKTNMTEAIRDVYSRLIKSLGKNEIYE